MMFVKRDIQNTILDGAKQVPVVAILGPRQSGKSTLARKIFPLHVYIDMQDMAAMKFAQEDPKGFLNSYKNEYGIIIDEAQYAPKLFDQIKVEADKNPTPGYYILSGSQNFLLHNKISESLSGRAYLYTLLPFSIHELQEANLLIDNVTEQIFRGFYPRVYQPQINFNEYYENYISTYVERDIRSIRNIIDLLSFKKFMRLCVLRIGSQINLTELAAQSNVSVNTIKNWLSLLSASYVLFLLPPYHSNLGKRVIKSPKLYFYDVGLAAQLMDIDKKIVIQNRTIYGALFENMIIVDLIKNFNALNSKPTLTFFRDSNKNEVDLIIESKGKVVAVEIKATETMLGKFLEMPAWFCNQMNSDQKPVVVYGGDQIQQRTKGNVVPWDKLAGFINEIFS